MLLLSVACSTLDYESRLVAKDAPVLEAMQQFSLQYPRFGYRRIHAFGTDRPGQPAPEPASLALLGLGLAGLGVARRRRS